MADEKTVEQRAQEREKRRAANARSRRNYRAKQKQKRAAAPRAEAADQPAKAHGPGAPKVRQGIVKSAKADKTIIVVIESARRHRMYKKIIRSSMTLHAHDERNEASEGDLVRIVEARPMSRTKRWRLTDVLERSR